MRILASILLISVWASLNALGAPAHDAHPLPIPLNQLGTEAQKQYQGDGISITPTPGGVHLRAIMQDLEADATTGGLWLKSVTDEDGDKTGLFRVRAQSIRRTADSQQRSFSTEGVVKNNSNRVQWQRPGLTEEYQVSTDGVRQDFLLEERLGGDGPLTLELQVTGATVTTASYGARLTLDGTGREIAYSQLHVTDSTGRELKGQMRVTATHTLTLLVDDHDATYPVRIDPTYSDADWVIMNPGIPGADDVVHAMAVDDSGNLYVGGDFTYIGNVQANHIAKWNGTGWSTLGTGVNDPVHALAVSGSTVYAGGRFTKAGGGNCNYIAQWNGTTWSSVGPATGTNNTVSSLVVNGTDLYAAGAFTSIGGRTALRVAHWNGLTWAAMGSGYFNSSVNCMTTDGTNIYVGGTFTSAGGVPAVGVARWNGVSWQALGAGLKIDVFALAFYNGQLHAGGPFTASGTVQINRVARWNGTTWQQLGSGTDMPVYTLGVKDGYLYAGGTFHVAGGVSTERIAKWDGSRWSAVASRGAFTGSTSITCLAVHPAGLIAGGNFKTNLGNELPYSHLACWDEQSWKPLTPGINGDVMTLAVTRDSLYIGGNFSTTPDGQISKSMARWNGSAWSAGPALSWYTQVNTLLADGDQIYAGGTFSIVQGSVVSRNIGRWDGTQWHGMGTGTNGQVRALAMHRGELHAGGDFSTAGGQSANYVAKWDGSAWMPLGSGTDAYVTTLVSHRGDLYAGGAFQKCGEVPASYIARWDGTSWSSLGTGMNNRVYSLASYGMSLCAGGSFSTAGGTEARCVARWDGNAWSSLGQGIAGSVSTLAEGNGVLYAGGLFTSAGGMQANSIAQWNGSTWATLGSGTNGWVQALAVDPRGRLFACGTFTMAGGKLSRYLARADTKLRNIIVEQPEGRALQPGMNRDIGKVTLGLSTSMVFTVANLGLTSVTNIAVTKDGANAADFELVTQPEATLAAAGDSTAFTVRFTPGAAGLRTATLHITSSDAASPFTITLSGSGTLPEISVEQPAGVVVEDGSTHPFGQVYIGSESSLSFTVKNLGHGDLLDLAATLDGPHSHEFKLITQPATTVAGPGGSTTFTVEFRPGDLGTRTATLHLTSNDTDESPYDITLVGTGTISPIILQPPVSRVRAEGASAEFNVGVQQHMTLPLAYEWRFNNKIIKGAITSVLSLTGVKTSNAGTYSVKISLGNQSVTQSAMLAVVRPVTQTLVMIEGSTLKPSVVLTGDATLSWTHRTSPESISTLSQTGKTLVLTNLSTTTSSGLYTCTASAAGGDAMVAGTFDVHVFNDKPLVLENQNLPDGKVGSWYEHQILLSDADGRTPATYKARNLPAGLTLNGKTGLISGIPTTAKAYQVIVSAANSKGSTSSSEQTVTITRLPEGLEGIFTAGMAREPGLNGNLGGRVDLTVTSTAAISGLFMLGTEKVSFKGALRTDSSPAHASIAIPRPKGQPGLRLELDFDPSRHMLASTSHLTNNTVNASVSGWRQVWKSTGAPPLNPATSAPRRFNMALRTPGIAVGLYRGDGYASFILGKDGKLSLAGKTPDGENFTCATFAGPHGQILLFQTMHTPKGSLLGTLDIDPSDTGILDGDSLAGTVSWMRPANDKSRISPKGLGPLSLNVFGALYEAPAAPRVILGITPGTDKARLVFSGGGVISAATDPSLSAFDFLPGSKPSLPQVNPGSVKITKLDPLTGLFSGNFTLEDTELRTGPAYAGKKLKRTAVFSGILTRNGSTHLGTGHFMLAEMPRDAVPPSTLATTPTTTTQLSGLVLLEKAVSAP